MRNIIFKNGNFTGISQLILITTGIAIMWGALASKIEPQWLAKLISIFGLTLAFVGGFSARAQLSGLRIVGEPAWKRAKRGYEPDDRQE